MAEGFRSSPCECLGSRLNIKTCMALPKAVAAAAAPAAAVVGEPVGEMEMLSSAQGPALDIL